MIMALKDDSVSIMMVLYKKSVRVKDAHGTSKVLR